MTKTVNITESCVVFFNLQEYKLLALEIKAKQFKTKIYGLDSCIYFIISK